MGEPSSGQCQYIKFGGCSDRIGSGFALKKSRNINQEFEGDDDKQVGET